MVWSCGKNYACTMLLTSKKTITITLVLDLAILTFFGLGNVGLFHLRLWRLVFGSYSKIHDSSPVISLSSNIASVSSCSRISWHTCTRRSFWSSFSNFGTIFAQIILIPRCFVLIVHTLSQFMCSSFAIILVVRRRSPWPSGGKVRHFPRSCLWQASRSWCHLPHPLFLP